MGFEVAQSNAAYAYLQARRREKELLGIGLGKRGGNGEIGFGLRMWQLAALQHNIGASLRVGDYYFYGTDGTNIDRSRASSHYRNAASLGSTQAMFNLGWMHQHGHGLPRDFHLSKRYYDQAIDGDRRSSIPATLALAHLWVHSAIATSSTYSIAISSMLSSARNYFDGKKFELPFGDKKGKDEHPGKKENGVEPAFEPEEDVSTNMNAQSEEEEVSPEDDILPWILSVTILLLALLRYIRLVQ